MKTRSTFFLLLVGLICFTSCGDDKFRHYPDGERLCFRLINGMYLTADRNHDGAMVATGAAVNEWETFYVTRKDEKFANIKSTNGSYVTYHHPDSILRASEIEAGYEETFLLIPHKEYFLLQTLDGRNVFVDANQHLSVSSSHNATYLQFGRANIYPASWFSIRELNWLPFITQISIFILLAFLFFKVFKNLVKENRLSLYMVLVAGFIFIYVIFNTKRWENHEVIRQDVIEYYGYLPAAFIFNDLSFSFTSNFPDDFNGHIWGTEIEGTDKKVPKFTMGVAFMYTPFFLIGHGMAHVLDYTTHGYSEPYPMMLCLGAWFYAFLSLFYLRRILLIYFNDTVTTLTLLSIALATNLFYYVTVSSAMTHAFSFCLYTLFIWNSIQWHLNKKWKTTIYLGLLIGLISLIRPTNALLAIVFMLFNVTNISSLKNNVILFWNNRNHVLLITILAIVVWLPQLIYWKYLTGNFFYFSYGDQGFFFSNPHIIDGLFSYRKGWLLYTPVMIFALLGIVFLYKKHKEWFFPLLFFNVINIYVIYSWWCWWYGGSFGSRPMVEAYALLAIPLAAFYSYFDEKKSYLRSIPIVIILLTTSLNLFQTQQTKTCLHYDAMSKEAYWTNFTTLGWTENYDNLLEPPDYEKALRGEDE